MTGHFFYNYYTYITSWLVEGGPYLDDFHELAALENIFQTIILDNTRATKLYPINLCWTRKLLLDHSKAEHDNSTRDAMKGCPMCKIVVTISRCQRNQRITILSRGQTQHYWSGLINALFLIGTWSQTIKSRDISSRLIDKFQHVND